MGFSRQEYWSGLPFPSSGDLPNPGIKLGSSALQVVSLLTELQGLNRSAIAKSSPKCMLTFPLWPDPPTLPPAMHE